MKKLDRVCANCEPNNYHFERILIYLNLRKSVAAIGAKVVIP